MLPLMKHLNSIGLRMSVGYRFLLLIALLGITVSLNAQNIILQSDFVSSYVWRGIYQTGVSVQPTFGFTTRDFSLTAWGSTDFEGVSSTSGRASKEIDLTLTYTLGKTGISVSIADLWWAGQGAGKYFHYSNNETAHHFEAGITYAFSEKQIPLSVSWYTMFAGMDKNKQGKQNISSYLELNYPFRVKSAELNATCGVVPFQSGDIYGNSSFSVTNLALKGSVPIKMTDNFSLPIFAQAIWNPCSEDAHIVFGVIVKP